jgi:hypothetical protein
VLLCLSRRRPVAAVVSGLVAFLVLVGLSVFGGAAPASAEQAQNANAYVFWSTVPPANGAVSSIVNYDQLVSVEKKAPATFWSSLFDMDNAPGGGYIGLQTDGNMIGQTTPTEIAIFSVWGADKYHAKDGKCGGFVENGAGYQCTAKFNIETGVLYRYRVQRLSVDKTGAWWGGWVRNTVTGKDTYLGELHSSYLGLHDLRNFSEYFQDLPAPHPCNRIPQSRAEFFQPQLNLSGETKKTPGTYQYASQASGEPQIGTCVQAQIDTVAQGSLPGRMITLGTAPTSALVATALHAQPVNITGEVFNSQQMMIDYGGGDVILTGGPAGDTLTDFAVDDKVNVVVQRPDGTTATRSFDFSQGCAASGLISTPKLDFTNLLQKGFNTVFVQLVDACGDAEGNTDIWAVADSSLIAFVHGT